MGKGAI